MSSESVQSSTDWTPAKLQQTATVKLSETVLYSFTEERHAALSGEVKENVPECREAAAFLLVSPLEPTGFCSLCRIAQLGVDTARFFHHKTNILMSKCDKFGKRHASPSILNTAGQRAGDSQLVGITPVACVSVSVIQKSKSKSVYGDMRGLSLTPNPDDLWFGDFRA